ncbi:MAG: hypothetical protein FJX30_03260 [Alphaproteobacteria bacterium]|nr:hypothetical protein [Alphaproteobacteria bacterium]
MSDKNIENSSNNNLKKNLYQNLQEAIKTNDQQKIGLINRLQIEIEKLLLIKEIHKNQKLLEAFRNDVITVEQEGSYHLIEMILSKEIELLACGDFEAIEMLEKLKKNAQKKIDELSKLAQKIHQNQLKQVQQNEVFKFQITQNPIEQYRPIIPYDGFHIEKSIGGTLIQVLDPDIKNLVTEDIVNSKPQDLSKAILDEIKNIKNTPRESVVDSNRNLSNEEINTQKSSTILKKPVTRENKGEWTNLVNKQEISNRNVTNINDEINNSRAK